MYYQIGEVICDLLQVLLPPGQDGITGRLTDLCILHFVLTFFFESFYFCNATWGLRVDFGRVLVNYCSFAPVYSQSRSSTRFNHCSNINYKYIYILSPLFYLYRSTSFIDIITKMLKMPCSRGFLIITFIAFHIVP